MTIALTVPANETARRQALRQHEILDTEAEQVFDDLTAVAAEVCKAPIALLTLVAEDRQWFKSKIGVTRSETPREYAFCAHTILESKIFEIPDAAKDPRFADNPYVKGDPNIRSYAGAPLIDHDGFALGTLCVIDRVPRRLTDAQRCCLQALGRSAAAAIEARRVARLLAGLNEALASEIEAHRLLNHRQALLLHALGSDESSIKHVRGLLPICAYCKGIRDESGAWHKLESYLAERSGIEFSHGICPGCCESGAF